MADAKPIDTPPQQPAGAQPGGRVDPFRSYHWKLLIDGVNEGHFTYCSEICVRVPNIRYREGGEMQITRQLPGPMEPGEVKLKFGLTNSPELWTWFQSAMSGNPQRKNVSIVMLGPGGTGEGLRWNLLDAWPTEWCGAPLDALGREVAIHSITLCYESFTRE
jgi:phage tail-like protein